MENSSKEKMRLFLGLGDLSPQQRDLLLERHKLGGIFPEYNSKPFKKYWVKNTKFNEFIIHLSEKSNLKGCLLKGIHLIHEFYDRSGERFMGDIDILVTFEDLPKWCSYLEMEGFTEIKEKKWKANDFKKIYEAERDGVEIVVELHTRLFYQESSSVDWEMEEGPYGNFTFLKTEDLFVHLAGHLAYQHSFHSLNWLYDLLLIISTRKIDWQEVGTKASVANVRRSVDFTLLVIEKYFGGIKKETGFYNKFAFHLLVTASFLKEPYEHKVRLFILKIIIKDNFIHSMEYLFGWIKMAFMKGN